MAENTEYYDGKYTGEEIDKAVTIALANKSYPFKIAVTVPPQCVKVFDAPAFSVPVVFSDTQDLSVVCTTSAFNSSTGGINATVKSHKVNANGETDIVLTFAVSNLTSEQKLVILSCILSQITAPAIEVAVPETEVSQ